MAYPITPPAARSRPGVVTAAVTMLGIVSVAQLITAALGTTIISDQRHAMERAYEGVAEADTIVNFSIAALVGSLGFAVVVAVVLGVLALLDAKGKQAARITTWVIGGLYLCCNTIGLIAGAAGSMIPSGGSGGSDMPDQAEVTRIVEDALPSWYGPTSMGLSVVALLCVLGAVILLALPAANDFFRKPAQQWEPPVPPYGGGGMA